MITDQIIELAIQGHASKRDAIKWAIEQERGQCAQIAKDWDASHPHTNYGACISNVIRARSKQCG
jgi:chitodextrinase